MPAFRIARRRTCAALLVLCALAAAALPALATDHDIPAGDHIGCRVETPYRLQIGADGIRLDAEDGHVPRRIDIHDGSLRIDGRVQALDSADVARLHRIEDATRTLLPEISGVAREAIHIGFDAMGGVSVALGSRRQTREFERLRDSALDRVAQSLERGVWSPELFDGAFEQEIEAAAEAMAARFTPARTLWMVLTGGIGRMERRMEAMEAELERSLAAREAVLEGHAQAMCGTLGRLHGLQQAMTFRLEDGRPLQVFAFDPDDGTATDDDNGLTSRS